MHHAPRLWLSRSLVVAALIPVVIGPALAQSLPPAGNPVLQNPSLNSPRSPGVAAPEGLTGAAPGSSAPGSRPATAPQIGSSRNLPNCIPPNCGTPSIMAPP